MFEYESPTTDLITADDAIVEAPDAPPRTLQRMHEKIRYQQQHKKPRSPLPGRQPTSCPDCDVTWIGLPRRGKCPDCALVYDEHTRAWRGKRGGNIGGPIFAMVISVGVMIMLAPPWWVVVLVALALIGLIAYAVYDMLIAQDGRFIATTPRGVVCRIRSHKTRVIPWGHVVFAEASAYRMPTFKVHGKNRAQRVNVKKALSSFSDGCAFAVCVEDGIKRYGRR